MKKPTIIFFVACLIVLLVSGCATVPTRQIPRPWNRVSSQNIGAPSSSFMIKVNGENNILIGKDDLTNEEIMKVCKTLIERRGYKVQSENYQYNMIINYRTFRSDKSVSLSMNKYQSYNRLGLMSSSTSGLGVSLAQVISLSSSYSSASKVNVTTQVEMYNHTVGIDVVDTNNSLIWKGDVNWESPDIDITNYIFTAFQTVFSSLPTDNETLPKVRKFKESSFKNFINVFLKRKLFYCPAVPYYIGFQTARDSNTGLYSIIAGFKNKFATFAYIDLLQTAEYAIPDVKDAEWENPINPNIWRKVMLGGKYYIGDDKKQYNVIIRLTGTSNGYRIKDCGVVSDQDYHQFQSRLAKWKNILNNYYDFYDD